MLPEMAASYAIGLLPTSALTGVHLFLHQRKTDTRQTRNLQTNLAKAGFYWAESEGRIKTLHDNSLQRDTARYRRSVYTLGGICLFLSWLGFLIQMLVMVSLRYLAVSRLEQKVYASPLAERELSESEVRNLLRELRQFHAEQMPEI